MTIIGSYAFSGCSSLTSIEIPNSVTSIGSSAFESCIDLTSINVDSNNTVYDSRNNCNAIIEKSGNTLISGCKNTVIPDTVTSIGVAAFWGCSSLTSIEIPSSVKSIGDEVFYDCSSLTSIEIPSGVTSIGDMAFRGCSSLTSIEIPSGVKYIESYAFDGCSSLTSIEIPSSVTYIEDYAFRGCSSLTSIKVDSNNTVYDSRNNCNAIITSSNTLIVGCKNTVIPDTVTSIWSYAFSGCSGLTSIEIPSSVTRIDNYAFCGCGSLTSIKVDSSNKEYDSRNNCNAIIETSRNELICGCKNTVIPDTVTSIGSYAFWGCSSLTSIEIPSSVTSIGYSVFYGCSSLTSIKVDSSNKEYDSRNNCNAIIEKSSNTLISGCKNTVIPDTVTSIGNYCIFWL